MFQRIIKLPNQQSFFLFGPRQTGKSTLLESWLPRSSWTVDLLKSDEYLRYSKQPSLFREEVLHKVKAQNIKSIFVDEVQKIPPLLDEIQYLMRKTTCQFALSGSSARKLKTRSANLLAGRAVEKHLFPLLFTEMQDDFDLIRALQFGTLPPIVNATHENARDILNTYAHTYLREEIQQEGIVRNFVGFSRFLDVACAQFTEITNYTAIGSECGLPARSVQGYYDILEDTLIGHRLHGFDTSTRKQLSSRPKFYFFDNGVSNAVNQLLSDTLSPVMSGKLFEQWIINEIRAYLTYTASDVKMFYWRTNNSAEIDLILTKHKKPLHALEFKFTTKVRGADLGAFRGFSDEHPKAKLGVISLAPHAYQLGNALVEPWKDFLKRLWDGDIT